MTANFSTSQLTILAIGSHIDLAAASNKIELLYPLQRYRDALHIDLPKGHIFLFDYGILVSWGASEVKQQQLLEQISASISNKKDLRVDTYNYVCEKSEDPSLPAIKMSNDKIILYKKDVFTLLAASHAFAQSCKLEVFEAIAEQTIVTHQLLPETLAQTGKIPLSRKAVSKLRGALFQTTSDIVLNFNLLDTPEFFWEYPQYETSYQNIARYLELKQRIEVLNLKLKTIHDLFDMLAAEQNHQHSSFLEWIIILLIAFEIVLFFVH